MKDNKRVCPECGGKASVVRKDYRFAESGLDNIVLNDIEVMVCSQCGGESPRIPNHDDLMRTIAVALIDKPFELAGDEVRFLRKYHGKSGEQFAQMVGIDRSHLSRIENGAMAVSRQTDRLVRTLALIHKPALLEKLKQLGRQEAILERLSTIESDVSRVQVQLDHAAGGYTYDFKAAA
jgi:putative zinc finger/helix-turn-helix YgiT family protein